MLQQLITKFIKRHHVMSIATAEPWSAALFYAWDEEHEAFVYSSGLDTRHAKFAEVSGSIVLETRVVGRLQGVQLSGRTAVSDEEWARRVYLRRFPFAAAMGLQLWVLEPLYIKYTDNTLGFGKKLEWRKE